MAAIYIYLSHKNGVLDETALELVTAAKAIDAAAQATAIVLGAAGEAEQAAKEAAQSFATVWCVANDALAQPNAEIARKVLLAIVPAGSIVLAANDTFAMDLTPGLSIKMGASFASDATGIEGVEDGKLKVVRQEYGGAVSTRSLADLTGGAVITVRAGAFAPDESKSAGGQVVDKSGEVSDFSSKRTFVKIIEAETGDVDITKSEVLVAVGRGIEEEDNIGMVHDLAKAMGADVCCSRPIVDAKWLEKARQVGTSGQTVKPKVYLALGISGSFQHMGGIKGNPFIVAVNKNPNAPIFQTADVGVVADILDFIPLLQEKIG
ncbi:MAG: electron transfer flavoprotein subunit alpha/FixB family protein [bacterium]|nr:electron transfer flavoprotein subunit alpha/FixB family protein [bacterium]